MSHPTRGAWIEMSYYPTYTFLHRSHPTRGAWIEIFAPSLQVRYYYSRTLPGVRGLKSTARRMGVKSEYVAPYPGCVD